MAWGVTDEVLQESQTDLVAKEEDLRPLAAAATKASNDVKTTSKSDIPA